MKNSLRALTVAVSVAAFSVVGVSPAAALGSTASPAVKAPGDSVKPPQAIFPSDCICRLLRTC